MTVKPVRRFAASWARELHAMYGVPVRTKITQSITRLDEFAHANGEAGEAHYGLLGCQASVLRGGRKRSLIWVYPSWKDNADQSEYRPDFMRAITAHELGHALHENAMPKTNFNHPRWHSAREDPYFEFFGNLSEIEYSKRHDEQYFKHFMNENEYRMECVESGGTDECKSETLIRGLIRAFPKARERNAVVREAISNQILGWNELVEFMRGKGVQVNLRRFNSVTRTNED